MFFSVYLFFLHKFTYPINGKISFKDRTEKKKTRLRNVSRNGRSLLMKSTQFYLAFAVFIYCYGTQQALIKILVRINVFHSGFEFCFFFVLKFISQVHCYSGNIQRTRTLRQRVSLLIFTKNKETQIPHIKVTKIKFQK